MNINVTDFTFDKAGVGKDNLVSNKKTPKK
jgi:hypothetical protein